MNNANDNSQPILNLPPAVKALCLVNILIFFLTYVTDDAGLERFALVPADPLSYTLLTHMFLHAGWLHLSVNIGMLMAFGTPLEKKLGPARMASFFFVTGALGALAHVLLYPDSSEPMVGASGGISGLFGGVAFLLYEGRRRKMLPFVFIWIGVSLAFGLFGMPGEENPIAWDVHIAGFLAGLGLYKIWATGK